MGASLAEGGEAREQAYMAQRMTDPHLTDLGLAEAEQLAAFYAPIFEAANRRVRIFPSPLLRCCATAWPLARLLGERAQVTVHPDVYENGGACKAIQRADGKWEQDLLNPGPCMSAATIRERFPGYETQMLRQEGQWYTAGFETERQSAERGLRVARWVHSGETRAT